MAMAHVKKNRLKDYWTKNSLFSTPGFTHFMTYDRFLLMLKHLHFCDNRSQVEDDKLAKIRIVLEDIREKFSSKFKPFRDLCIDESLVLWRGRLSFRQFMPLKRHKFGMKLFIVRFSHPTYTRRPGRSPNVLSNPTRLVARHFPSEVPASNASSKPRRRCHVCAHSVRRNRKRQTTHWMCSECDVGLCLPDCFREYHTLANFWGESKWWQRQDLCRGTLM